MARIMIRAKSPIIITFVIFSTPFFRPRAHTPIPITTDIVIKTRLSEVEESILKNTEETADLSMEEEKEPERNFQK